MHLTPSILSWHLPPVICPACTLQVAKEEKMDTSFRRQDPMDEVCQTK
jgi:hypothetical protein